MKKWKLSQEAKLQHPDHCFEKVKAHSCSVNEQLYGIIAVHLYYGTRYKNYYSKNMDWNGNIIRQQTGVMMMGESQLTLTGYYEINICTMCIKYRQTESNIFSRAMHVKSISKPQIHMYTFEVKPFIMDLFDTLELHFELTINLPQMVVCY